jgi:hypothetical protein
LLGIEDIKTTKKDGGANDAATSGAAGKGSKADASVDGGKSGTGGRDAGAGGAMDAGKGAMDAGGGGKDAGARADSAIADAGHIDSGSQTQDDGMGNPTMQTVNGTVIDYFRHPLADVSVTIGATTVTTGVDGAFTIADVALTYDVALTLTTTRNNSTAHYGWLFEGLTRADPTLQIYRGLPDRSGELMISVTPSTLFPLASDRKILMDFAGSYGEFDLDLTGAATDYISAAWIGPASTQGTAHALLWTYAGAQELPATYLAHDAHPVALTETSPGGSVSFDLDPSTPLTTGMVSGTVTNPPGSDRKNQVFVRFTDGAVLLVADDAAVQNDFSYAVPTLANAGITVAALKGDSYRLPFAVAYQDNLAVGQNGISLSIPTPPSPTAPAADATGVDSNTMFQWSGGSQVFVFEALSDPTYDAVFVVTTNKQTKIPAALFGLLPANALVYWSVETHGSYASVDDATASDGLLDAFSYGRIRGPRRGAGSYTESEQRGFTTKP